MRVSKPAIYTAIGILFTPVAIFLAMLSGGMGHGHYEFARLLFPYTILLTLVAGNTISPILVAIALVQFPAYGLAVGLAARKANALYAVGLLGFFHLVGVAIVFSGLIPNFS